MNGETMERISIPEMRVNWRRVMLTIEGSRPLMMHNPSGMRRSDSAPRKSTIPTPEDEAEGGLYRMGDGRLCLWGDHVRQSIINGAGGLKAGEEVGAVVFFNRRCSEDGYEFDSEKERDRYRDLRALELAGAIEGLRVHPVYVLARSVYLDGRKKPPLRYEADFDYQERQGDGTWRLVVEDVKPRGTARSKSYRTALFRAKRHLMMSLYCIEVREVE